MQQLHLAFESGLSQRYESVRECLSTQVYQRGLVRTAGQLDLSPSKLTEKLAGMRSDGKGTGITLDELERYVQRTGDVSPIHYLADKYCRDPEVTRREALDKVADLMERLPALLAAAGVQAAPTPKGRRRD